MTGRQFLYIILLIFFAAGAAILGALGGGWVVYQMYHSQATPGPALVSSTGTSIPQSLPATTVPLPTIQPTSRLVISSIQIETAVTQAVEKVGPAVVTVLAKAADRQTRFGPVSGAVSSGSGVIITNDGYVVTNNHVVEGAQSYSVVLANGQQVAAQLIGTDPFTDLAVVKLEGEVPATASFGNSDALKPGESVIAIGSPLGDFRNTVTAGVISALGRSLDTGEGYLLENMIQTDAAINQGNSGGPLVNLAGQVIGINTLIVRGGSSSSTVVEGLGFAIPSNTVHEVVTQLIATGAVSRPYLGIRYQSIDPQIARIYRLPVQYGAYVTQIIAGSPADKAGIREDDIIIQIGDLAIDETRPYSNALYSYKPGDTVVVTLMRGKERLQVKVTLEKSE